MDAKIFLMAIVVASISASVFGDLVIELKDGSEFVVPVDRHKIQSITFSDRKAEDHEVHRQTQKASQPALARSGISTIPVT
mgnify:CR=1 FL=1